MLEKRRLILRFHRDCRSPRPRRIVHRYLSRGVCYDAAYSPANPDCPYYLQRRWE